MTDTNSLIDEKAAAAAMQRYLELDPEDTAAAWVTDMICEVLHAYEAARTPALPQVKAVARAIQLAENPEHGVFPEEQEPLSRWISHARAAIAAMEKV